jgi:hypothetical protein
MTKTLAAAALAAILGLGNMTNATAADLGTALRESGWDRIIGTWVDPETKGTRHKVTYQWRYKDKLIEIINREAEKETTALMGRNPKSGEVFHVAADNEGGSSIGKWTIENGEAVLGLLFVTGTGEEGGLEIRHKLEDADTMLVTVVLPEPITFRLVRMKTK